MPTVSTLSTPTIMSPGLIELNNEDIGFKDFTLGPNGVESMTIPRGPGGA
jgi:hypothetical protein